MTRWWLSLAVVLSLGGCKKTTVTVTPDPASKTASTRKVVLGPKGVDVEVAGKHLAPGCQAPGPGVTVPKRDGGIDEEGLRACMVVLKKTATDDSVEIGASNDTPYQTIVTALDATREDAAKAPLFPSVSFTFPSGAKGTLFDSPVSLPLVSGGEDEPAVVVAVSKTAVIVDETRIVEVPNDATRGLAAEHKTGGIDGVFVSSLGNALSKRNLQDRQIRDATGKKMAGPVVFIADRDTPYRLFFEALYTITRSFPRVNLLVRQK